MPGHSLPVRQGLSSLGLWGLTPAKPLPSQLPRPRCGTGRGNASPPPAHAHRCWASVWHSLPLPSSSFFFFFKYQNPTHSRHTLPLSRCDASRICPQSEAASAGPALPGAHCRILPSASVPCRTDSRCVFSPAPERASKRLARRRAQGRGSSSPQTRPPRGRSELSVCVELRNRTEGGCPTGDGGESRSSWPAQRRRHLIRSAGCRFCKSPARCEHYVTSFP